MSFFNPLLDALPANETVPERENRTPLVSVVVPVYNVEKYLGQCLDSLVHQSLPNIEIIAVNDASTDKSAAVLKHYESEFPNLRVIHHERNRGLSATRNTGLATARGKYITFVDGDDWVDAQMLELMQNRGEQDASDVIIADVKVYDTNTNTFFPFYDRDIWDTLDPVFKKRPFHISQEPRVLLLEPYSRKMFKRAFLEDHDLKYPEGIIYEDFIIHFASLWHAKNISLVDKCLQYYRTNRPGQITGRCDRRLFDIFVSIKKIHDDLTSWGVSQDIWAIFLKVKLRVVLWLLSRVEPCYKEEFFAETRTHLQMVPTEGFAAFARQASALEVAQLKCLRKHRLKDLERLETFSFRLRFAVCKYRLDIFRVAIRTFARKLLPGVKAIYRRLTEKLNTAGRHGFRVRGLFV